MSQTQFFIIAAGLYTESLYINRVSLIDTSIPGMIYSFVDQALENYIENYELFRAYPNPFNPATTIAYNLLRPGHIKLTVYNTLGKNVTELVNDYQMAGNHSVLFDAQHLATGICFYQLQVDGAFSQVKKMVFQK